MLTDFLRRLFGRAPRQDPLTTLDDRDRRDIRVVVGLGNPGARYAPTRHNVGFLCAEALAARLDAAWQDDRDGTLSLLAVDTGDVPLVVAKPQTYMNSSGDAVVALVGYLDIEPRQLLVVYDDMDLALGSLRIRERGSAGTHNGMRSVVASLGTSDVPRLRIGIGQARRGDGRDYVLAPFAPDEEGAAAAAVDRAADAAQAWASEGAVAAMNRFNG